MVLLEIMTICSLIYTAPYYDCSEEWKVYIYDDYFLGEYRCPQEEYVTGFAIYSKPWNTGTSSCKDNPLISHYYPSIHVGLPSMGETDNTGTMTVLEHELKHLKCRCNFHGN